MVVLLLFTAVFLLYAKSKYFPVTLQGKTEVLRRVPWMTRAFGYSLMLVALWRLAAIYGSCTGVIIWLNALMLTFGVLVIGLPLLFKNQRHAR